MAQNWNGNEVPVEGDPWQLVTDIRRMADYNNRLIPVASKAQRDQLAASAPNGTIPAGTTVLRLDQATQGPVFDVFNNGAWIDGDTGWVTINPAAGYTAVVPIQVRRRNGEVEVQGTLTRNSGIIPTGTYETMFTLPAGYRPANYSRRPLASYASATGATLVMVLPVSGQVQVGASGGETTDVYLAGKWTAAL